MSKLKLAKEQDVKQNETVDETVKGWARQIPFTFLNGLYTS